jgi:Ca2+-binding EF-hand superfamily protein
MRWLTLRALAVAALAGAAIADPPAKPAKPPPPPPKLFVSPAGEPFRLSPSEPDPLAAWFNQVDAKRQGYIDRDEFRADAVRFFRKLDENGDGVIDGFEVADYEAKIAPELAEWSTGRYPGEFGPSQGESPSPDKSEHRHGQPPQHDAGYTASPEARHGRTPENQPIAQVVDEPEPVSGADFSLDSHITLAEWMRATDDRFELLDTAHTGRLTLDALRARLNAPAQRR